MTSVFLFAVASLSLCACSELPVDSQVLKSETQLKLDYLGNDDFYSQSGGDFDGFDWSLTKRVASLSEENFLLSPLGLKLTLAILVEAATGPTQSELSSVLGFALDRNLVRKKFASFIKSLKKESPNYILNLGSRIYISDNATRRERFAAIAQEFYNTELKTVDFGNPPVAAKDINSWVSNITHGRIPDLINKDDVANMVMLVLNTIYFRGSWHHQFAPNATKLGTFYVGPKTSTNNIPFMNVKNKFFYTESAKFDAKILRMPYLGHKYAMYIIVPNSLTGLPRVLDKLAVSRRLLRSEIGKLREHYVDVTLPKFQFLYTSQLDGVLKELGVRAAFDESASLPGIARAQLLNGKLRVSKVLQRSGIEVNELGSIAYSAAETSVIAVESQMDVLANRPFLFFIQDEVTSQLLFTGRVADPSILDGAFKMVLN